MARVRGVKAIRAAIRAAPEELQEQAFEQVEISTKRMYRDVMQGLNIASQYAEFHHGETGMRDITGIARRTYKYSLGRRSLKVRVGLLSSAAFKQAIHLQYFFKGTPTQPARPVHDDVFEGEREVYYRNQQAALDAVMRQVFQ